MTTLPEAIETVLEHVEEWESDFACPSCGAVANGPMSGAGAKLVTSADVLQCSQGEHFQTCELRGAMDLLEELGPSLRPELIEVVEAFEAVPEREVSDLADHLEDATSPGYWSEAQEKALGAIVRLLRSRPTV